MSVNILNAQVQRFASDVELLLQQTDSRLQPAVDVGTGYMGKQVSPVEQIAAITASKVTTRGEPMPATDATFVRRWVLPEDWDLAQRIDSFDSLRLALDQGIKSKYAQNAVAALNRAKDNVILSAMFGTNLTGETAGTSTTFPNGQVVGVSVGATTSNLTVAKLKRGMRTLLANDVDLSREQVYCAITASQHEALLNEIEITSQDFNPGERPVLADGMVTRFLGINFIHTELVPTGTDDAAGTSRSVPLFVKSGVHLGIWSDIAVDITKRRDLRSIPWQVYTKLTIGATRLDEEKVVRIWCREA
jgi:hypothetical protein